MTPITECALSHFSPYGFSLAIRFEPLRRSEMQKRPARRLLKSTGTSGCGTAVSGLLTHPHERQDDNIRRARADENSTVSPRESV